MAYLVSDRLGRQQHFLLDHERYQQGEISFDGLAKAWGVTTWELSHLLEERGWPTPNPPSAAQP